MSYIHDNRYVLESEELAAKLQNASWLGIPLLHFIASAAAARPLNTGKKCVSCNGDVDYSITQSIEFGKIAVLPSFCNTCRVKDYELELHRQRLEGFRSRMTRCANLQNKPAFFRNREVGFGDIKDVHNDQTKFIEYIESIINGDKVEHGLFVYGTTGIGKTFLAKLLHNELLRRFEDSCFVKAVDLAMILRRSAISREYTAKEAMAHFSTVPTLFIDDFGTQKNTEFIREALFSIIDDRYENKRRTIITTNLTQEDLKEEDARLISRLSDESWMKFLWMTGNDLRRG